MSCGFERLEATHLKQGIPNLCLPSSILMHVSNRKADVRAKVMSHKAAQICVPLLPPDIALCVTTPVVKKQAGSFPPLRVM